MLYPTIPGLVIIAVVASVTVTAAAGLKNRPSQPLAAPQVVFVTSERINCEAFNRAIADATARLRSGTEAARLNALHKDCAGSGMR